VVVYVLVTVGLVAIGPGSVANLSEGAGSSAPFRTPAGAKLSRQTAGAKVLENRKPLAKATSSPVISARSPRRIHQHHLFVDRGS
jgi:hypothetical protein